MTPLDSLSRLDNFRIKRDKRHRTGQVELYYVYVLQSEKDGNFYVGYTCNLKNRVGEHNNGKVRSTSYRRPLRLIYFEGCLNEKDVLHREKYLKTSWGKRYIKVRIKNYLSKQEKNTIKNGVVKNE